MPELNSVQCPQCQKQLKLKNASLLGKKVPCPKCGFRFVIELPAGDELPDENFPVIGKSKKKGLADTSSDPTIASTRPPSKRRSTDTAKPNSRQHQTMIIGGILFSLCCAAGIVFLVMQKRADRVQKLQAAEAKNDTSDKGTRRIVTKANDDSTSPPVADANAAGDNEATPPKNNTAKNNTAKNNTAKNNTAASENGQPPAAELSADERRQSITRSAFSGDTRQKPKTGGRRIIRGTTDKNSNDDKPAVSTRRNIRKPSSAQNAEAPAAEDRNTVAEDTESEAGSGEELKIETQEKSTKKDKPENAPTKKSNSVFFSIKQPLAAVNDADTTNIANLTDNNANASIQLAQSGRRGDDDDSDSGLRFKIDPQKLEELKKKEEENKKSKGDDDDNKGKRRSNKRGSGDDEKQTPKTTPKPADKIQPAPNKSTPVKPVRNVPAGKQLPPSGSGPMPPADGGGLLSQFLSGVSSLIAPDGKLPTPPKPKSVPLVGKQIKDFTAATTSSTTYRLSQVEEKLVVVTFMGVECPLANLYFPRLEQLQAEFKGESVAFLAVNSNDQDTLDELRDQVREYNIKYPVVKDPGHVVADLFQATRTPEVFVLDEKRVVRYHGLIDDQYGYFHRRPSPSQHFVYSAVRQLLEGREVEIPETELTGCHIGQRQEPEKNSSVTYYKDVLPLFQKNCQECHRENEIGPFALENYDEVQSWGETIKEAVVERRMPPWKADPQFGQFRNDMSLSQKDLATIVTWVDNGCPAGNAADAPAPVEWTKGWNIGKPDKVYAMPKAFVVPPTGVVDYQHIVVSPPFKEDRWIKAAECRYGNPSVVHHMLVLLNYGGYTNLNQDGLRNGFFISGVPGSSWITYPKGYAKKIPKGARLVFQMHYTANGSRTSDRSRVGVIWANESEITHEIQTYAVTPTELTIPAGDPRVVREKSETMPQDVHITSLMPHLHLRGTSFKYLAEYPDGRAETLLSIPFWDFNWQHQYHFKQPKLLPKGTKFTCIATWDNSENNPSNILPPIDVHFGEQTTDEMFIGYVNYVIPRNVTRETDADTQSSR